MLLLKEFDVQDDCLIVRLTGDLDHHETDAFREEWMTYLTNYPTNHVILSLKGVEFIDLGREDTFLKCVSTRWVMNRLF